MDRFIYLLVWIANLFEVESSDPLLAAFKRARRSAIVLGVGEMLCLLLALTLDPGDLAVGPKNVVSVALSLQGWLATGFALMALVLMLGMVYFAWVCWRIYTKPERFI
jgi:hypothetical protein